MLLIVIQVVKITDNPTLAILKLSHQGCRHQMSAMLSYGHVFRSALGCQTCVQLQQRTRLSESIMLSIITKVTFVFYLLIFSCLYLIFFLNSLNYMNYNFFILNSFYNFIRPWPVPHTLLNGNLHHELLGCISSVFCPISFYPQSYIY